jgi:hypothetical protein
MFPVHGNKFIDTKTGLGQEARYGATETVYFVVTEEHRKINLIDAFHLGFDLQSKGE